jgi:hypothetical protein
VSRQEGIVRNIRLQLAHAISSSDTPNAIRPKKRFRYPKRNNTPRTLLNSARKPNPKQHRPETAT